MLVLHPENPDSHPDIKQLHRLLHDSGLIGGTIGNRHDSYLAGENFLQLITFMGCSPHIRLEPESEDDPGFCYVRLTGSDVAQIRVSEHARPPRCWACRKPVARAWREEVSEHGRITCPYCHQSQQPHQLRWRNDSGMGRCFIEIHNIFPGEAQPVAGLMQQLQAIDAAPWRYFYLHS